MNCHAKWQLVEKKTLGMACAAKSKFEICKILHGRNRG